MAYLKYVVNGNKPTENSPPQKESIFSSIPNFNKQNLLRLKKELPRRRLSVPTTFIYDTVIHKSAEITRRHSVDTALEREKKNQNESYDTLRKSTKRDKKDYPGKSSRESDSRIGTSNKVLQTNKVKTSSERIESHDSQVKNSFKNIESHRKSHQIKIPFKNYCYVTPKSRNIDMNDHICFDFAQRCLTSYIESGVPLNSYGVVTTTNVRQGRYSIDVGRTLPNDVGSSDEIKGILKKVSKKEKGNHRTLRYEVGSSDDGKVARKEKGNLEKMTLKKALRSIIDLQLNGN